MILIMFPSIPSNAEYTFVAQRVTWLKMTRAGDKLTFTMCRIMQMVRADTTVACIFCIVTCISGICSHSLTRACEIFHNVGSNHVSSLVTSAILLLETSLLILKPFFQECINTNVLVLC